MGPTGQAWQAGRVDERFGRAERVRAGALVAGQFVLLLALVLLPGPRFWLVPAWLWPLAALLVAAGAVIAGLGAARLGAGLTASPLPARAADLRTTGVYALVRHPIYTGLLAGGLGLVLASGRPVRAAAWLALLVLLSVKARFEERRLRVRFPGYGAYADRTPRLWPRLWRRSGAARP